MPHQSVAEMMDQEAFERELEANILSGTLKTWVDPDDLEQIKDTCLTEKQRAQLEDRLNTVMNLIQLPLTD